MPPVMTSPLATMDPGLVADRIAALRRVRDLLVDDRDRVLRLLTEVATYRASEYEIDAAVATLDGAERELDTYRPGRVPRMAVFMPSNVLLFSYVLYLLVPSLYTESICFRPSRQVGEPLLRLHDLLAGAHKLPLHPRVTSQRAFLRDVVTPAEVVVFTGTYQNAELIRPTLRPQQLFAYLGGGVNPFVVAAGADLTRAVGDAVEIRILNSGQDCLAPDLFVVNQDDLADFLAQLVERLGGARYGPLDDPTADYGPIFYDSALEQAALYLLRHERQLIHGGRVDVRQRLIEPAVIVGELSGKVGQSELFAPIFHVVGYHDEAALARTLSSGLFAERAMGASVYGGSPQLVEALAARHTLTVNESLLAIDDGNAPFGGRGPMANYLAHGGRIHAEPILLSKAVAEYLHRMPPAPTEMS